MCPSPPSTSATRGGGPLSPRRDHQAPAGHRRRLGRGDPGLPGVRADVRCAQAERRQVVHELQRPAPAALRAARGPGRDQPASGAGPSSIMPGKVVPVLPEAADPSRLRNDRQRRRPPRPDSSSPTPSNRSACTRCRSRAPICARIAGPSPSAAWTASPPTPRRCAGAWRTASAWSPPRTRPSGTPDSGPPSQNVRFTQTAWPQ